MSQTALEIQEPGGRQVAPEAPKAAASPITSTLERVVMDPSLPVERVEKVLALYYQAEDRARQQAKEDAAFEARKAYYAAMSACQKELPVVTKNKHNDHTKSTYADLAAIEEQAMPIIHSHGFAVSFQPDGYNDKGELRVRWEISHEGGHSREGIGEIPVDGAGSQGKVNKTGTQAFGSTATYGRRYLLCMLFNITTGDDNDGNRVDDRPAETVTEDELVQLRDMLAATESDEQRFCSMGKIARLSDMPRAEFQNAMNILRQRLAKRGQS